MANFKVKFDPSLDDRLERASDKAQKVLDDQVIKDTEPYVPMDSKTLADSAMRNRKDGEVVYDTPYAKRQYYGAPRKSRDKHPLAVMRWFEAAKSVNKQTWLRVAKKAGGNFK